MKHVNRPTIHAVTAWIDTMQNRGQSLPLRLEAAHILEGVVADQWWDHPRYFANRRVIRAALDAERPKLVELLHAVGGSVAGARVEFRVVGGTRIVRTLTTGRATPCERA
jgi:hypothetical protein